MDGNKTERISSAQECREAAVDGLLESASDVARRVLESIQALAGTTNCKGVQIAQLKKWAIKNKHWIENPNDLGVYSDRGSENEVYMSRDGVYVLKLNDFRYSDGNLMSFFERISAHNKYFPDCAYRLVGFSANKEGDVCAVLKQRFVLGAREATEQEIFEEFERLGFHAEDSGAYFSNGFHDIFDAVPNNVLVGADNNLYFIDTIIFQTGMDGISTYRKYSPRI